MRTYILTEFEKRIIEEYIKNGLKLNGFYEIKSRFYKNAKKINNDIKLLYEFARKLELESR